MSWVDAMKKYAELNGGKFKIPKKDSEEYAKVKEIQEQLSKGDTVKAPKPKAPAKKANVDPVPEPAPVSSEPTKSNKVIPKPVKVENVVVEPLSPVPDPPKKIVRRVKKEKTPNTDPVPEEAPFEVTPPVKVPKVKKLKVANVDKEPVVEDVVEVKAPKKSPKEIREEKQEMKNKQSEIVSAVRAKKTLIDVSKRLTIKEGPVVLDFN